MAKCNGVVVLLWSLNFILMAAAVNAVAFEYFQLVQQYPPATCSGGGTKCQVAPVNRFTIHGLWPGNFSNPIVCTGSGVLNPSTQLVSIRNELDTFWPNVIHGNNVGFWIHEWNFHGICSNYNQLQYFSTTLNLHANPDYDLMAILNAANFVPSPGAIYRRDDIASAIQAATGKWPCLKCQLKDPKIKLGWKQLYEITLCFHSDASTLIDCPRGSIQCDPNIKWF